MKASMFGAAAAALLLAASPATSQSAPPGDVSGQDGVAVLRLKSAAVAAARDDAREYLRRTDPPRPRLVLASLDATGSPRAARPLRR
jgi:hypothetical protein